ncbi:NAD(P)/FAD-dependent oxidoreductase [Arthrobacter sp. JSM 101049]|uniref:NAD(P)/FAD-dependent oxidoreductase n=1 Tax=Arthrobacter sp. JSM 101049 TaxID=929097 RepID=UPI003562CF93
MDATQERATHEHAAPGQAAEAGTVIIGGGQAGLQVADSLRAGGYTAPVTIIADEAGAPYQRPPLSKDFLLPGKDATPLPLRGPDFLADHDITLRAGAPATAIDRAAHTVALADGSTIAYEHLVLATGARNRSLSCPGADLPGIHGLKTLHDAEALHRALPGARDVVVVGAGFIGLEFAAAARAHGARVTVLEFAPRPMGRALSPLMGDWFAASHAAQGVELHLGEGIGSFTAGDDGRVAAAVSTAGTSYPADLVVVGIGVVPHDALAAEAGLEVGNGIVVDGALRTSDPSILAVGDCANFPNPHAGTRTRLESVQNATDQGRHAAATILGTVADYTALPWFWSTQGPVRLQIAGLTAPGDETTVLGDPADGRFSVLCHREGQLAAVESVNSPADHMAARKLIAAGAGPDPAEASTPGFSLKAYAKAALRVPAAV